GELIGLWAGDGATTTSGSDLGVRDSCDDATIRGLAATGGSGAGAGCAFFFFFVLSPTMSGPAPIGLPFGRTPAAPLAVVTGAGA
ncbi:hypothetical protein PFISCL1PPCAC_18157, partial [Pristionchus fissidentatus]